MILRAKIVLPITAPPIEDGAVFVDGKKIRAVAPWKIFAAHTTHAERHGVREYWLVHPTDHVLTRYRLEGKAFGPALIDETEGSTEVEALPGLAIEWGFMATDTA